MQSHERQKENKQDENWEAFSLCSSDCSGSDERLPIPGRESHTCDLGVFSKYLEEMKSTTRQPQDQKFNIQVWDFIKTILEKARPIGYAGVNNRQVATPKGPTDNQAFINKVVATNLINPIHPNTISDESGIPLQSVLTELLYATKAGMMSMKLMPNCLRSSSVICAMQKKKPSDTYFCEGCRYDNSIDCLQKIKVVFVFNIDVFYALAESFETICQPSKACSQDNTRVFALVPATFSGSGFRYFIGCGEADLMLSPALPKGLYRMRCPVTRADTYLRVHNNVRDTDSPGLLSLNVSDIVRRPMSNCNHIIEIPHGRFHLDVFTNTKSFFVCWIQEHLDDRSVLFLPENERKPFTTAHTLLSHPTYRRFFANGTEVILRNVLNQMMMNSPNPYQENLPNSMPSRRNARPIRSLLA